MALPTETKAKSAAVKTRLVASGGRLAQEFGFNRVAGEVLVCLYLTPGEASLDALEEELRLSKAAVSQAAAQLERLGLIQRVRKPSDRKRYYRSADDFGSALRNGILKFARARMSTLDLDLQEAAGELAGRQKDPGAKFLAGRIARIRDLNRRTERLLENPLVKLLSKLG